MTSVSSHYRVKMGHGSSNVSEILAQDVLNGLRWLGATAYAFTHSDYKTVIVPTVSFSDTIASPILTAPAFLWRARRTTALLEYLSQAACLDLALPPPVLRRESDVRRRGRYHQQAIQTYSRWSNDRERNEDTTLDTRPDLSGVVRYVRCRLPWSILDTVFRCV